MEVRSPEAGFTIDRNMILVTTLNQVLVRKHGARAISMKFLVDSSRANCMDGHFEMEYELKDGALLRINCKENGDDMIFKVRRNGTQLNYSVPVEVYVSDDFVPTSMLEYEDLVMRWLNDLK
ncbi:MAG: hypothetical protein LN411_06095 [Candidatus Thermoplasmatota archaeon]|nr:hypothetical protein [Candidatus Thermoplasmatota archaeon]